jgi:hypothetical protein
MRATFRSCLLLRRSRSRLLLRLLFLLLSRLERFISKEEEKETALDRKEAGAEIREEEEKATWLAHVQQPTICGRCSIEYAQWFDLILSFLI